MSSGSTGAAARKAFGSASRLWAALGSTVVLFIAWAAIAAHPWAPARPVPPDPRLVALQARQQRLNRAAGLTDEVVRRRWVAYQAELAARRQEIAAVELRHQREIAAAAAAAAAITDRRVEEEARAARDARVATNAALAAHVLRASGGAPPTAPPPAPPSPAPTSKPARPAPAVAPPPPPVAPVAPVASSAPAVQPPARVEVVTLPPIASTRTS